MTVQTAAPNLGDARSFASALLPYSWREDHAVTAWARLLLEFTISALEARGELTTPRLWQTVSALPAEEYGELLAGTQAESLFHTAHGDLLQCLRETVARALDRARN